MDAVKEAVTRYIPGLGSQAAPKSKRSRAPKKKEGDAAHEAALTETAPTREELPHELKAPLSVQVPGASEPAVDDKPFSAVPSIQKRLKATQKKLQRISGYEAQVEALNPDQRKAVASKPALEAVVKELTELTKVVEAEEADDKKRLADKKAATEKHVQSRIAAAVANANESSQTDLALLLQFLHLYSLFHPSPSFAPPVQPPIVANATGQEASAVFALFHSLSDGPLLGSDDAAVSKVSKLQHGSEDDIVEGVSYAKVKQMIMDLTAAPEEIGHEIPATNGVNGDLPQPTLSFMQASELDTPLAPEDAPEVSQSEAAPQLTSVPTEIPRRSWADEDEDDAPIGSSLPKPGMIAPPTAEALNVQSWEADEVKPINEWASEVDTATHGAQFDSAAQAVPTPQAKPNVDADGFQPAHPSTGNRGRGRGRGSGRGFRGGHRSEGSGNWREGGKPREDRPPRQEGDRPPRQDGERRGRGGRGRGAQRGGHHKEGSHTQPVPGPTV